MKNAMIKMSTMLAVLGSGAALAAPPTAQLDVVGSIKVPGCTVMAGDNNGIYDYGPISPTSIKPGKGSAAHTKLGSLSQTWEVLCDAQTFVTYTLTDNRQASSSIDAGVNFGLGYANTTGKIGYYNVKTSNAKVDSVSVYMLSTYKNYAHGTGFDSVNENRDYVTSWTATKPTGALPMAGTRFSSDMEVTAYLGGTGDMEGTLTGAESLDGSLTISYAFGL